MDSLSLTTNVIFGTSDGTPFIIGLYLAVTLGIGLYAARYVKSLADYIFAGRSLPLWLVMPTTFALWFGAETVMGASHAMANDGIGWDVLVDPIGAAFCLVAFGLFYARPLYRTGNLTIMDFYTDRYGPSAGMFSASINAPSYLFWVGAQLFAFGVVIEHVFGLSLIPAIMIGAIIIVIYTMRGGLRAITITEFLEMIVIVICLFVTFVVMAGQLDGGFWGAFSNFQAEGKMNIFASIDPAESSSGLLGLGIIEFFALLLAVGAGSLPSQDLYERANSAKTEDVGAWGMIGGGILYMLLGMIPLGLGVMALEHYGADQVAGMEDSMILNLVDEFGGWMRVAFYAALISALLSTASAAILAPSILISLNILRPMRPEATDAELLRTTRRVVFFFAFFSMLLAMTEWGIHDLLEISSTITLVSLVVPLTAGLYWKRATLAGCLASTTVGMLVYAVFSFVSLWQSSQGIGEWDGETLAEWAGYAWLFDASFGADAGWYLPPSMVGLVASMTTMYVVSRMDEKKQAAIVAPFERLHDRLTNQGVGSEPLTLSDVSGPGMDLQDPSQG